MSEKVWAIRAQNATNPSHSNLDSMHSYVNNPPWDFTLACVY